jgi:putative addiction module component (TIGR02574 family)
MDIQKLSTSQRIQLAEQLWDSVRFESDAIEVTPELRALLDSRLEALNEDGDIGDSWENVKARIIGNK